MEKIKTGSKFTLFKDFSHVNLVLKKETGLFSLIIIRLVIMPPKRKKKIQSTFVVKNKKKDLKIHFLRPC